MTRAAAPFLRWAGGKRRLLPLLHAALPTRYGRFFEPFVGGGALLFSVDTPGGRCVLGDTNPHLVACYTALRDNPDALIAALRDRARDTSIDAYLAARPLTAVPPADDIVGRAARMIYLNRLSFQGLYRENSRGEYNTPYGHLTNPTVCDEELLRVDARRLAGAVVRHGSYANAVADAVAGDFVYFDPPYLPLTATSSFSKYNAADFTVADHERLATVIADLAGRGVYVMLSNSDTPLTREIFSGLRLYDVRVRRSISAKATSRVVVGEVLGVSYDESLMRDAHAFTQAGQPQA